MPGGKRKTRKDRKGRKSWSLLLFCSLLYFCLRDLQHLTPASHRKYKVNDNLKFPFLWEADLSKQRASPSCSFGSPTQSDDSTLPSLAHISPLPEVLWVPVLGRMSNATDWNCFHFTGKQIEWSLYSWEGTELKISLAFTELLLSDIQDRKDETRPQETDGGWQKLCYRPIHTSVFYLDTQDTGS